MSKSKKRLTPKEKQRRTFLRSIVMGVGVVGASMLGVIPVIGRWFERLRPPGALQEDEFLSSCIKCGQCVQVCPVNAIKLADLDEGFGIGVPYIDARAQACDFSCDGLQCVLACPTGALAHELDYPADTRMGVARVARPGRCLAISGEGFKGLARGSDYDGLLRYDDVDRWNPIKVADYPYDLELCDLCVRQCPIEIRIAQCAEKTPVEGKVERVAEQHGNECPPVHAIAIEEVDGIIQPVIKEGCVGCGVCEMICPPEPPAIVIDSARTLEGQA
jgi:ferredoxin-type protein NapG